jgi:hypothetical protein
MPAAAPRYHPAIRAAVIRLDDENVPIAETARRIGDLAASLGLPRPNYTHVRRLVHQERELRHARRALAALLRHTDRRTPA